MNIADRISLLTRSFLSFQAPRKPSKCNSVLNHRLKYPISPIPHQLSFGFFSHPISSTIFLLLYHSPDDLVCAQFLTILHQFEFPEPVSMSYHEVVELISFILDSTIGRLLWNSAGVEHPRIGSRAHSSSLCLFGRQLFTA